MVDEASDGSDFPADRAGLMVKGTDRAHRQVASGP